MVALGAKGCWMTPIRLVCAAALLSSPLVLFGCMAATALTAADEHGAPVVLRQERHGSTLIVDLRDVTGHGELVFKRPNTSWPQHLVIRITPGAVHGVLVRTEVGILFTPVADTDPAPRDIPLQRSLYSRHTSQITVRWEQ
jgi:hypothetical protein